LFKCFIYLVKIDETDDNETVKTDESDDNEPETNYNELYNEILAMTKKKTPVFIKDYERNMNQKIKEYHFLFIDNSNDETLNNKRFEWLKNIKKYLDGDNDIEYETVHIPYQYI
jgi:hypothetical protein